MIIRPITKHEKYAQDYRRIHRCTKYCIYRDCENCQDLKKYIKEQEQGQNVKYKE